MSSRSCNFCNLKRMKKEAAKKGNRIIVKSSLFMGGNCVFEVPKGQKLPMYIEPNKKLPNGDDVYQKYSQAWMMSIGDQCEC